MSLRPLFAFTPGQLRAGAVVVFVLLVVALIRRLG